MEILELKPIVESLIFVSEEPVTEMGLLAIFEGGDIDKQKIRECVALIEKDWSEDATRGLHLVSVAGGYQFRTKETNAEWIKKMNIPKPMRLSQQALETLAIIAYKQPIVRSEVEKIRGVDSGGVMKTLLERRLLRIVGRQDEPGQPLLYGTTKEFMEIFNLKTLSELPTLRDIEELMRERKILTESQGNTVSAKDEGGSIGEMVDDESVDATEVVPHKSLGENDEEEKKDMQALENLEESLKRLKRLEKAIFPKPIADALAAAGDEKENEDEAADASPQEGSSPTPAVETTPENEAHTDAPQSDDSAFE